MRGEFAIGDVVGVNNSENLGLGDSCGQRVRWLAEVGLEWSRFFISELAAIIDTGEGTTEEN